jgi:hypothetical protein
VTDVTTDTDQDAVELSAADEQVLSELTERARAGGLRLTGQGGLLAKLTKWWSRARWRANWTITSATPGTTRRAATAGIPATATGPRR